MNRFSPKTSLLAILLLAVFLRLPGIVSRPIWYDESFSLLISQQDFSGMLAALSADVHPFAYYIGLWAWVKVLGDSVVVARVFSILASILDIVVLFLIANEFFHNRKFLPILFILFAISPFHIHYAQEIRMYSWMSLWLHLATLAFLRARRSHPLFWWAVFAISAFLAQQTQTLALFYLATLALLPLFMRDWVTFRRLVLATFVAILLYLPTLGLLIGQIQNTQSYWIAAPDIAKFFTVLVSFTTGLPLPGVSLFVGLTIAVFLLVFAVWKTIKFNKNYAGFWFIYLAFVPGILMFLFSLWKPVFVERALLASASFFLFWLYWAIFEVNSSRFMRQVMLAVFLIASGIGIFHHLSYQEFPYAPFKSLIRSVDDRAAPGDLVLHSNKLTALPAYYYASGIPAIFLADPPGSGTDTLSLQTANILGVVSSPAIDSAAGNASVIWFILFKQEIEEYTQAGFSGQPDLEWLSQNYVFDFTETWGDVLLYRFYKLD
jgi:mannosyltransferase